MTSTAVARLPGWMLLVLSLCLLLGPLREGTAGPAEDALARLAKAQEAEDVQATIAALVALPDAFEQCKDEEARLGLVSEAGWVAMSGESTEIRIAAIRTLGRFEDPDLAWEELERVMPTADQAGAGAVELAAICAAGELAPTGAVGQLIRLAKEGVDPKLASAAIEALGGYGPEHASHKRVLNQLVFLAARLHPARHAAPDEATKSRWTGIESSMRKAFAKLTGRDVSVADFLKTWEREYGALPKPAGKTTGKVPPQDSARQPTPTGPHVPWSKTVAALRGDDTPERLAAVDLVFERRLEGDDVRVELEQVIGSSDEWRTMATALRALAYSDTGAPVPDALVRRRKARRWQVRLALAEGLVAYRHETAVKALIDLLGDKRMRVRQGAAESLSALTGQDHGTSQKAWAKWLRKQKGELTLLPPDARPKKSEDDRRRYAFSHNQFFSARIRSDRVVLVLDKSESMYWGLFDQVIEEVAAFLASALPTTFFALIEFDDVPRPWQKKLSPANAANAEGAIGFLQRKKPHGATNIIDSLRMALSIADVDSVVLLSDGLPNRGSPEGTQAILEEVRRENRYTRVAIHTLMMEVGRKLPHDTPPDAPRPPLDQVEKARRARIRELADSTELGAFMRQLAKENEGSFDLVFADWISPPPGASFRDTTDK